VQKKNEKILFWILSWAALLVAVLYSPMGSPELYSSTEYYYQNGIYSTSANENISPLVNSSSNKLLQSFSSQTYELERNSSIYTISNSEPSKYLFSNSIFNQTDNSKTKGNRSGVDGFGGNITIMESSGKDVLADNNSVFSMTPTTTLFEGYSNNRQSIGYGSNTGASDPGEDPTGSTIPVGDNFVFLLFLALGYVLWKEKCMKLRV